MTGFLAPTERHCCGIVRTMGLHGIPPRRLCRVRGLRWVTSLMPSLSEAGKLQPLNPERAAISPELTDNKRPVQLTGVSRAGLFHRILSHYEACRAIVLPDR